MEHNSDGTLCTHQRYFLDKFNPFKHRPSTKEIVQSAWNETKAKQHEYFLHWMLTE